MSSAELNEMVRVNIQEVLAALIQEQPEQGASTSAVLERSHQTDDASRVQSAVAATCSADGRLDPNLLNFSQSSEATIRLLRARLKSVEEQLGATMTVNYEKDTKIAELQQLLQQNSLKDAASIKSVKALEAQIGRHRRAAEAAREALAYKELQLKELSEEGAQADKDRRVVIQESRTRDVRLQRALEEVQKYKALLQEVKMQGQEVKDVARSDHVKALSEIKSLQRQKAELLLVLRKQTLLVSVLRRQRAHLEAARLLAFTEEEFLKTLDAGI